VVQADFVPPAQEITATYEEGTTITVTLHDGSTVRLRKLAPEYDPSDRARADRAARAPPPARRGRDRPAVRREARRRHARHQRHHRRPLSQAPVREALPGKAELDKLQQAFR
jgi:2-oxoglutarate ferredoxin oxidoreductase subunit beta